MSQLTRLGLWVVDSVGRFGSRDSPGWVGAQMCIVTRSGRWLSIRYVSVCGLTGLGWCIGYMTGLIPGGWEI